MSLDLRRSLIFTGVVFVAALLFRIALGDVPWWRLTAMTLAVVFVVTAWQIDVTKGPRP